MALMFSRTIPAGIAPFTFLDPPTYSVDGLRRILLGTSRCPLLFDLGIVTAFLAVVLLAGVYAFEKTKV